jgi:hypothetical protein
MTSLEKKMLWCMAAFGLVAYVIAIEPNNAFAIKEQVRRILNFPALFITAVIGFIALKHHAAKWLQYVWWSIYIFEMIVLAIYGAAAFLHPEWATTGFRNFVSSLRHLLISPLPYMVLLYLGKLKTEDYKADV